MLNRTVVLAKSWCWCDYDWTPHVLEKCKIRWAAGGPAADAPGAACCTVGMLFATWEIGVAHVLLGMCK